MAFSDEPEGRFDVNLEVERPKKKFVRKTNCWNIGDAQPPPQPRSCPHFTAKGMASPGTWQIDQSRGMSFPKGDEHKPEEIEQSSEKHEYLLNI